jgi:phosphatidylinositol-3-phosphatase
MSFSFSLRIYGVLLFLFLGVIAETGCGGGSLSSSQKNAPASAVAPSVSLSAQPNSITSGASAMLNWRSSNATSVTIAGLGTFAASGSVNVTPSATTTYTAIASGPGGSADAQTTVSVTASPTPLPGPNPPPPPPAAGVPTFNHVFLLVEENHGYSSVIGNSAMPYLNSLASHYGLATQYYANTHPSIGNYLMMTTGQIITNDDSFTGTVNADNIVRHLLTAGKTWKSYAESLPNVGYTGGNAGPYLKRHNPLSYFSDVVGSQSNNLVPFSQFATDLQNNTLPDFSFIVPNALDDGHDGSLNQADGWLNKNIAPLINSPAFQNSLLVMVFDEAETSDTAHGGGHVAAVIVSPNAKQGYQSTTLYQHQSTLRLVLEGVGVKTFPGAAASATDPAEFF